MDSTYPPPPGHPDEDGMLDEDEEEAVEEKVMSEFAKQPFRRTAKKAASRSVTGRSGKKRHLGHSVREEEEEEEEIDEADQAETDEFFSQLIQPVTNEEGEDGDEEEDEGRPLGKKRPRWHPQESDFFRQCAALFDCNYTVIQDFLPHRSVPDLKKQYDRQRVLYSSLYASFATTPRFESVEEYERLKGRLEEAKEKLHQSMSQLGIKPWATAPNKKRSNSSDDEEEEEEHEEEVSAEDNSPSSPAVDHQDEDEEEEEEDLLAEE